MLHNNQTKTKKACERIPDNIVIATGGTNQLECIDCITNQNEYDEYYKKCVDLMLPVGMFFRRNKKLKNQTDTDTLNWLNTEIFDEKASHCLIPFINTSKW